MASIKALDYRVRNDLGERGPLEELVGLDFAVEMSVGAARTVVI